MSIFYIDLTNSTTCFVNGIKKASALYKFEPKNKMYYMVDTTNKVCIGVDNIPSGSDIVGVSTSYKIINQKFVNL